MKKIIKGLFKGVLVITLITALSIPVFASEANDPIGRSCVASGVYSITMMDIHK